MKVDISLIGSFATERTSTEEPMLSEDISVSGEGILSVSIDGEEPGHGFMFKPDKMPLTEFDRLLRESISAVTRQIVVTYRYTEPNKQ